MLALVLFLIFLALVVISNGGLAGSVATIALLVAGAAVGLILFHTVLWSAGVADFAVPATFADMGAGPLLDNSHDVHSRAGVLRIRRLDA